MWKVITLILFIILLLGGVAVSITMAPHYIYTKLIENDFSTDWYKIQNYQKSLLKPSRFPYKNIESRSADNLWKQFHIGDVVLPLPYRHPFYKIIPLISSEKDNIELGLSFKDRNNKELAKVYFVKNSQFKNKISSQKLFKLPVSRDIISKVRPHIIWADMFSKDIGDNNLNYTEMIYNLYLIQLRHSFIHETALSFGNIGQQDVGIIMLDSIDKDYDSELIMTMRNGLIYSYVLFILKGNPEAEELRERMLSEVRFERGDVNIAKINYNEFKALGFERQRSQEGLLYLYSSWSNWEEKQKDLFREIVFYAERGGMSNHLDIFYQYALDKYGTSFTTRNSKDIINTRIKLSKKMEEEDAQRFKKDFDIKSQKQQSKLSAHEKLLLKLKAAKSQKRVRRSKLELN
jgi:hypothetical protein